MSRLDKEVQEGLYDPKKEIKMSQYLNFVKAHKAWRVRGSNALDFKRIGAAWKAQKKGGGHVNKVAVIRKLRAIRERKSTDVYAPRGQHQSIASESQRAAMFAEIDRKEARKNWSHKMARGTRRGLRTLDPKKIKLSYSQAIAAIGAILKKYK